MCLDSGLCSGRSALAPGGQQQPDAHDQQRCGFRDVEERRGPGNRVAAIGVDAALLGFGGDAAYEQVLAGREVLVGLQAEGQEVVNDACSAGSCGTVRRC